MKIESMRTRSYRSFKVDDADLPAEARERLSAIRRYDELRAAGCAAPAASREIGVSRRTMCRWKAALAACGQRGLAPKSTRPRRVRRRSYKPSDAKAVLDLRRKHPFMGKAPIQRMLERKGLRLSVSTVGRILSRAIAAGAVPLASVCEGRVKPRRRRRFDGWARRWKYGDKAERPGQLVQIDHMTFSRDGRTIKEFRAICPVSRFMVARVFSRATAFRTLRAEARGASSTPSSSPSPRPCSPSRSTAAASSWPSSRTPAGNSASTSASCRRGDRSGTGTSNAPTAPPASSSGLPRLRPHRRSRLQETPRARVLLQVCFIAPIFLCC